MNSDYGRDCFRALSDRMFSLRRVAEVAPVILDRTKRLECPSAGAR